MEEYKVGEPLLETIDLKKYFKLKMEPNFTR